LFTSSSPLSSFTFYGR